MTLTFSVMPRAVSALDGASSTDILNAVSGVAAVILAILALWIAFLQLRKYRARRSRHRGVFELDA